MAIESLNFFDLTHISTDDPDGFSDNGGYQFDLGVSTVTISPTATSQAVSIDDTVDANFDDDDAGNQTLNGGFTLNGTFYPDGTAMESEYEITVQDGLGTNYVLQFVSVGGDAYNIEGFIIQGDMPPWGEALTVVGRQDMTFGSYAYSTSTPACFGAATRIELASGELRTAMHLKPGDMVRLADGGAARVQLVLRSRAAPALPADRSVRIRAGALGNGRPFRDFVLSPQHGVFFDGFEGLVPAKALRALRRVGPAPLAQAEHFVHVVLRQHALIMAEGVPCESLWPGKQAMADLSPAAQRRARRVMGARPEPLAPLMTLRGAQRSLAERMQEALAKPMAKSAR